MLKNGAINGGEIADSIYHTIRDGWLEPFEKGTHPTDDELHPWAYKFLKRAGSEVAYRNASELQSFFTPKGERVPNFLRKQMLKQLKLQTQEVHDDGWQLEAIYRIGEDRLPMVARDVDALLKYITAALTKAWPVIANKIRALYFDKRELVAFFADKDWLGRGILEEMETCMRPDGEYRIAGKFFRDYRRTRMLALVGIREDGLATTEAGAARCIVHFTGGHRVVLTNFYYNHMVHSRDLFIVALKQLFGHHKISYRSIDVDEVRLPVYLNGGACRVTFGERPVWTRPLLWPCPHCGTQVTEHRFVTHSDYAMGCSSGCAQEGREDDDEDGPEYPDDV